MGYANKALLDALLKTVDDPEFFNPEDGDDPATFRRDCRAIMTALYHCGVWDWFEVISQRPPDDFKVPTLSGSDFFMKHREYLNTCMYNSFPTAMKYVADKGGEGFPPDYRELLYFMQGSFYSLRAECARRQEEERGR